MYIFSNTITPHTYPLYAEKDTSSDQSIKACSSAFRESFRLKLGDCKSVWVLKYTDIRQIVNYCVVLLIKGFF